MYTLCFAHRLEFPRHQVVQPHVADGKKQKTCRAELRNDTVFRTSNRTSSVGSWQTLGRDLLNDGAKRQPQSPRLLHMLCRFMFGLLFKLQQRQLRLVILQGTCT
jgi:hypothetical protein